METLDVHVDHERGEPRAEFGVVEGPLCVGRCSVTGPDREGKPSSIVVAAQCPPHEAGLVIGELDLDHLVERTEARLVDSGREAKRQDLEHLGDATVR